MAKTSQLQIRVTPREKARLKRLAAAAGQDVSAYVLSRVHQPERERFENILGRLARADDHRYALAELHDFLVDLAPFQFPDALSTARLERLSPFLQTYVAAMVEHAARQKDALRPAWTAEVAPLESPYFGTALQSLRTHLLCSAPVAFKRRNIFIDAAVGERV